MKKFLALILTLALVMSMNTVVFAANITTNNGTDEGEVKVEVSNATQTPVYKVVVNWDALTFTYDFGEGSQWDPEDHVYTEGAGAGWDNTEADISITNHSDIIVYATAKFNGGQEKTVNGVKVTVDSTVLKLDNAAEVAYGDESAAPKGIIKVTVSEKPNVTEGFVIPGVIVTITTTNPNPSQGE